MSLTPLSLYTTVIVLVMRTRTVYVLFSPDDLRDAILGNNSLGRYDNKGSIVSTNHLRL